MADGAPHPSRMRPSSTAVAHAALRDVSLRRALYAGHGIDRRVPRRNGKALTQRDQRSTGLCWLYAAMTCWESEHDSTANDDDDDDDEEAKATGLRSVGFHPDMVALYRRHLKGLVRAVSTQMEDDMRGAHALSTHTHAARCAGTPHGAPCRALFEDAVYEGGTWAMAMRLVRDGGVPLLASEASELPRSAVKAKQMHAHLSALARAGASVEDMDAVVDRCLGPERTPRCVWHPPSSRAPPFVLMHAPDREAHRWYATPSSNDPLNPMYTDVHYTETLAEVRRACLAMLQAGRVVYASFAIDLSFDRAHFVAGGAPLTELLPVAPRLDKAERMRRRDLRPSHAMVIVGVDDYAQPTRWRIHNSWGKPAKPGDTQGVPRGQAAATVGGPAHKRDHGDLIATDAWLADHLFGVVVHTDVGIPSPAPPTPDRPILLLARDDVLSVLMTSTARAEALAPRVGDDPARLVVAHASAMALQRAARAHLLRHTRRPTWPHLRRALLTRMEDAAHLDVLNGCTWVRREWRHEPQSWTYMLVHAPDDLRRIVEEVTACPGGPRCRCRRHADGARGGAP